MSRFVLGRSPRGGVVAGQVLALLGPAALAVFLVSGWTAPHGAGAASLQGLASVSGAVDSPAPFRAAQVTLRNVEKRVLYMVYTLSLIHI